MYLAYFEREPYKRGYAEGKKNKALTVAAALLKAGIDPEIISRCTGLNLDKIDQPVQQAT